MAFFNWVKGLLGKKGEERKLELKTEIDVKPVIEENAVKGEEEILEEKLAEEKKLGEELIEEEKKVGVEGEKVGLIEKDKKPRKEKKQKAEKKLKIETESIIENIGGVDFIFCSESLKKFKEEFCESGWEIDYDINDLYITRKKGDKIDYFHRWLKQEEIEDFIREKNCDEEEVVVHHRNFMGRDNRITNLKVMGIGEYNSLPKK